MNKTTFYLVESDPINEPSRFVLPGEPLPPSKRIQAQVIMAPEVWIYDKPYACEVIFYGEG